MISKFFSTFTIILIKLYQFFISPIIGPHCRYLPTCSEYFMECLKEYGLIKGFRLGTRRILKCHPFKNLGGSHGVDFVPIPRNASRQERLKKIVDGLQKAGWKYEDKKESKNG